MQMFSDSVLTVPNGEILLERFFLKLEKKKTQRQIACDRICNQLSYRRLTYA